MFRWLVNVGFLALPIAATLGILLGIQSHRQATGQAPLFVPPRDDKWVETTYCQKSFGIHPESKGQQYTLNPNQWAWNQGDAGFLCMNVTTFNNQTYATRTTAPAFKVWQYPPTGKGQPVHAFPNIKIDGGVLPAKLDGVRQIAVDVKWTMRLDNRTDGSMDANVNSNVAIDMFVDGDSSKAAYEVMVWFAAFGPATFAIGQEKGPVATKTLAGTDFNLYHDKHPLTRQTVLTWKAVSPVHDFQGDIGPLVNYVLQANKDGFPTSSDYLGYLGFGSEAYDAAQPVTFSVPLLSIDIQKSS